MFACLVKKSVDMEKISAAFAKTDGGRVSR